MSVEWFHKLKEFDSLSKMRIKHLKAISNQDDRLSKLQLKQDEALSHSTTLKQNCTALQLELDDLEAKLKLLQEQRQRLMDIGGDEQKVAQQTEQIHALENKGFELLEAIECMETERRELNEFLLGLERTLREISQEAATIKIQEEQEISRLDMRLQMIENELPEDFRILLNKVRSKNLAHGPFTRIEQGSCYFCRFKISRLEESEIDLQQKLKVCSQCGRIFLPYGG